MRENHIRAWVEVVGSVTKNIAEFNEKRKISAPCMKSKAAVRGRKVAGPAESKNIAEFNEIRNPVSVINTDEEKSGSVALRPARGKIPPPCTAYGAFPPYTIFYHEFLAIVG